MKTSLLHLPEGKQQEIQRIAEIIREVANPEMIILFGSYAKGTYVEHRYHAGDGIEYEYISDYDFLVVTQTEPEEPHRIEGTIMNRVDRYRPPVNLEIHSIDYINDGLSWGQYFFTDIVNEGIIVFERVAISFTTPRILTPAEEKQKAKEYFDVWFPQAHEFITDSCNAMQRGSLNIGAFYLHQATESLYYAILLVFTGYKPKLHNLWRLRKKTKAYDEELFNVFKAESDKVEENLFDLLKRGYIDARYKQAEYSISKAELETLIDRVEKMEAIVKQACSKYMSQLG